MTRKDYMDGKVTHDEFYGSVAKAAGIDWTSHPLMPRVIAALANGDEHLNTIPLNRWDLIGSTPVLKANITRALKEHGDFWSLACSVCTLKAAAKVAAKKA